MNKRKKLVAILAGIMAGIMVLSLILSLIPVASAAPTTPPFHTAINNASMTMLAMPATTVSLNPRSGRSAVIKKLWNMF